MNPSVVGIPAPAAGGSIPASLTRRTPLSSLGQGEGDRDRVSGAPCESRPDDDGLAELVPVVRRVVGARVRDPDLAEDLVQETLTRVVAARSRVEGGTLAPYAATTARNVVASHFRREDLAKRKAHLLAEDEAASPPIDGMVDEEDRRLLGAALARLPAGERDLLVAHEVEGQDTRSLAASRDSTPGAVAAALSRSRAKLRVEYLLLREDLEPLTDRCRPVLRALSAGDRRRQRELDAGKHLLHCAVCAQVASGLLDRRAATPLHEEVRIPVERDADVVTARRRGREVAEQLGFSPTDATLLATAISEMARNIVKFAVRGDITVHEVSEEGRQGVTIVVRDVGPGIPDLELAMRDGYSTYNGLGLGLPGARRLMDQFDVVTEAGRGTTITMTKWRSSPPTTRTHHS
jgi:RNA polymerase sigma factor (sigma-70 family)